MQSDYGVNIVDNYPDINLNFIHGPLRSGCKNVLRIDGVYYDKENIFRNKSILSSVRNHDAVIFQSEWSKVFVERMLNVKPKKTIVIYNGADFESIQKAEPYKHSFDRVFVCSAFWRPNKRLKTIVNSFFASKFDMNCGLFVIGKPDYIVDHPNIKYFHNIDNVFSVYKGSNYACHICHLESCSNSVVEALVSGLPVLCNNIGGTPEIVKDSGCIMTLDSPFDFRPVGSMKSVGFCEDHVSLVSKAMIKMTKTDYSVCREDLYMKTIAKQYYNFFVSLLS